MLTSNRTNTAFGAWYDSKDEEILRRLAEIEAYKETVQRLPVPPQYVEQINHLVVSRTIHGTVALEGSPLTEEDARQIVDKGEKLALPGRELEKKEALAAQRAHEYVRHELAKESKITEAIIRHIHKLLTEGIPYPDNVPGEYRRHPAHVASYVPPQDAELVQHLMEQYVEWLNSTEVIERDPAPIRAILAHYFFVLIHPFGDGNGRTARAIESLILYQGGYNIKGFYSLSNYYYRNRDEYFGLLQRTRTELEGDQTQLLRFALRGFVEELRYVQNIVVDAIKKLTFENYVNELTTHRDLNNRQRAILRHLLDVPDGISLDAYRSMAHPLTSVLYQKLNPRTLARDLREMQGRRLVRIVQDADGKSVVKANLDVMDEFV